MTADAHTQKAIKGWVADLAQLVKVDREHAADDEQLRLYARMLCMENLPSTAFTTTSLHAVARDMTWWPDYASLRVKLTEWWREAKPPAAPARAYDGEAAAHLSPSDRSWLDYYHRRRAASGEARREHLDSLLRGYAPAAWKIVAAEREAQHPAWLALPPPDVQDQEGFL